MPEQDQDISINVIKMEIKEIREKLTQIPNRDEVRLAIKGGIEEALKSCDNKYASKDRLGMIERVVYGMTGAILLAFMGAVIGLVIIK
jgi:hypothetical protein